jgi:hypothetical protein
MCVYSNKKVKDNEKKIRTEKITQFFSQIFYLFFFRLVSAAAHFTAFSYQTIRPLKTVENFEARKNKL